MVHITTAAVISQAMGIQMLMFSVDYTPSSVPIPGETIFLMDILQSSPIDVSQIHNATSEDPVLSKV